MTVLFIYYMFYPHSDRRERKNKEKFWMYRLKSFRRDGMNKQMDFIKMNVISPDTHIVFLSNVSIAPLSLIIFLHYLLFV